MTYDNRNKGALPPSFQGSERANVEPHRQACASQRDSGISICSDSVLW